MRERTPRITLTSMAADPTPVEAVLHVEIDAHSDPLTGRIRDEQGNTRRAFTGWLAATAALEWLAEGAPEEPTR